MTTEEKKKKLQNIIASADDELTNVLMETAVEYQTTAKENFIVPQEWIDEAYEVSKAVKNGSMKTYTLEETIEQTKRLLKEKHNVDYTPNI